MLYNGHDSRKQKKISVNIYFDKLKSKVCILGHLDFSVLFHLSAPAATLAAILAKWLEISKTD